MSCTRKRGITSGLSWMRNLGVAVLLVFTTSTSGMMMFCSACTKGRPGLGSSRAMKGIAALITASLKPQATAKRL